MEKIQIMKVEDEAERERLINIALNNMRQAWEIAIKTQNYEAIDTYEIIFNSEHIFRRLLHRGLLTGNLPLIQGLYDRTNDGHSVPFQEEEV